MIKNLPEGTSIGEMKASMQWILSHTARFAGLVLVTIQGSRGFILINMGKPLVYYFRHGNNILNGHPAYEYFQIQPVIQFELRKYTAFEMTIALSLAAAAEGAPNQSVPKKHMTGVRNEVSVPPDTTHVSRQHQFRQSAKIEELSLYEMDSAEYSTFLKETIPPPGRSQDGFVSKEGEHDPSLFPQVPSRPITKKLELKETDIGELILGQIINLPGVLAVTIFGRGLNVLSIGEINPDNLVDLAEGLIESAKGLSSVMRTGPFIQVTLQIPAGNIIIAPYYDEYACILTNPGINLGQIRKIIRELPGIETTQETVEVI